MDVLNEFDGLFEDFRTSVVPGVVFADVTTPDFCATLICVEAGDVASDVVEFAERVIGQALFDVGEHGLGDFFAGDRGGCFAVEALVHIMKHVGGVVGSASDHDSIDMFEVFLCFIDGEDAAIDFDDEFGVEFLEFIDFRVAKRRDVAVFLGAKSLEPCLACVHGKALTCIGFCDGFDEVEHMFKGVVVIDTDAMFYGDRD